jgi:hypothetical protein
VACVERLKGAGRTLIAIYRHGDNLVLRVGSAVWPLDGATIIRYARISPSESTFEILRNGAQPYSGRYRHRLRSWFERNDVAADEIDSERDHLMKFVAGIAPDNRWRATFYVPAAV